MQCGVTSAETVHEPASHDVVRARIMRHAHACGSVMLPSGSWCAFSMLANACTFERWHCMTLHLCKPARDMHVAATTLVADQPSPQPSAPPSSDESIRPQASGNRRITRTYCTNELAAAHHTALALSRLLRLLLCCVAAAVADLHQLLQQRLLFRVQRWRRRHLHAVCGIQHCNAR